MEGHSPHFGGLAVPCQTVSVMHLSGVNAPYAATKTVKTLRRKMVVVSRARVESRVDALSTLVSLTRRDP